MSDQPAAEAPSEAPRVWDSLRWLREPLAWTLLGFAAIILLVSVCQLFNLAGAKIPILTPAAVAHTVPVPVGSSPPPLPASSGPAPVSAFDLRASAVAPQFTDAAIQLLPVLAVLLVAFSGGLTDRARQVVQTAAVVLALAFVFGVITLVGSADTQLRPGTWFVLDSTALAITAAALIFTGAVLRSRPLRSLAPGFYELEDDEEDFEDDTGFGERA